MSRLVPFLCALAAATTLVASRGEAQSPEAGGGIRLFPRQAQITEPSSPDAPFGGALVRLPLPPSVLGEARPDLSDVRVHDAYGEEVPYAIDHGEPSPSATPTSAPRVVVPYDATEQTSRAAGLTTSNESYRLRPPSLPRADGIWELVIEADAPELLRRIVVSADPPFGERREIFSGAIFRFPQHGNARMSVRLPGVTDEPLHVELRGEGPPLHPRFLLREVDRTFPGPPTAVVPLAIRERREEGTRTILVVDRPAGLRTQTLFVSALTASFVRPTEVASTTPAEGRVVLGTATLQRIAGVEAPELLGVGLREGGGDTLEIAIENADSPPLADPSVTAEVRVPALLFDQGASRTLRWGGRRARPARYDLMATRVADLLRGRALVVASLGPVEDNPSYDPRPALEFAMRAGQPVALERYTHRAGLAVPSSEDGLSSFRVTPALWAEGRQDLADLRIVDAEGRQWPYLFGVGPADDELAVTFAPGVPKAGDERVTVHRATLPVRVVAPTTFRAELPPQLVSRRVTARGTTEDGREVELGVGFWSSPADAPAPLEISLFEERVTALWIEVENGDEAPLALERGSLVLRGHDVYVVAPAGEYAAVVGDLEATSPVYDAENARALVLVLAAAPATLGDVTTNPSYHEPTFFERSGWETIVLSAVLALVVLVLFALTMRVARETAPARGTEAKAGAVAKTEAVAAAETEAVAKTETEAVAAPVTAAETDSEKGPGTSSGS